MRKRKLGRTSGHRKALFRALVTSLLVHGKIETTEAKAKAIRAFVDEMITLGKRGDLHSRRRAAAFLVDPGAVKTLFETVAPRYQDRPGGYTRIIKKGPRLGDGAPLVLIELV